MELSRIKEYEDREKLLLKANEAMLHSKGFKLFVVTQSGGLEAVESTTALTLAERAGLRDYHENFTEYVGDCEDEDAID